MVGGLISRLDGSALWFRYQVCTLGILLDPALCWESQVATMSRSAFHQLRLIAQLCPYLDERSVRTLMQALVISGIDYCNVHYMGLPLGLIQENQWV